MGLWHNLESRQGTNVKESTKTIFIDFFLKPVAVGLFVAAVLLLVVPELRPSTEIQTDDPMALRQSDLGSDWSGAVSYASAVSLAAPSVVNIYTLKERRSANDNVPRTSLGSGVIMQSDGIILTNHHVIDGAVRILVLLYDGREAPATIIGSDPEIDLAVLKINIGGLTPITVGEPSQARIGDVVLAIGNPSGIGQSVTQGIISAKGRNIQQRNIFENFIQTDADINTGSSGGALIDAYGNLLGINTATLNGTGAYGISFAIPADAAEKVLQDILQFGRVVRGWLGMTASPGFLPGNIADQLGISQIFGVTDLTKGGPAEKAGMQRGDIIFKINGAFVTDPAASVSQIVNVSPGQPIKLSVLRKDQVRQFSIIAGDRGEAIAKGLLQ